jgi:hypothetical protein
VPVVFEFAPALKLLRSTYTGVLDDALLRLGSRTAGELAARLHPQLGITDLSQAAFRVSAETIRHLAGRPIPPLRDIPRAVVAPTDLAFGMARMYQIVSDDHRPNLQVVRSMREAYQALGITAEPNFETISLDTL